MHAALTLLLMQGLLGAWDTLWYHEWHQQLPQRPSARRELRLHASRDFAYAIIFGSLAWLTWDGWYVWCLSGVLLFEIGITLWDFVEEDLRRKLPAGERVMHTIMGIIYGAFLACLLPEMAAWSERTPGWTVVDYGITSRLMTLMAVGVALSGVRDLAASYRSGNSST
jgi:hypothetical protein